MTRANGFTRTGLINIISQAKQQKRGGFRSIIIPAKKINVVYTTYGSGRCTWQVKGDMIIFFLGLAENTSR